MNNKKYKWTIPPLIKYNPKKYTKEKNIININLKTYFKNTFEINLNKLILKTINNVIPKTKENKRLTICKNKDII